MIALRPGMPVREVVPGDPQRVLSLATQLLSIAAGFDQSVRAFTPESRAWFGPAHDAFAALISGFPPVYRTAALAFATAAVACRTHAAELDEAQRGARAALARVEDAVHLTAVWQLKRREREQLARAAAGGDAAAAAQLASLPQLGDDPGEALMRTLRARIEAAQRRVAESAHRVAPRFHEAAKARIAEPNLAVRAMLRAGQVKQQFEFGVAETTFDLGMMAVRFNPARVVLDPKAWATDTIGMAAGLKYGVKHPVEFVAAVTDWETWCTNPGRAMGRLAPTALIGGATLAGRGATATKRIVDASLTPRTFTSKDPLVGDVANALEEAMPGRIVDVNCDIPMFDGDWREIDIDLGDLAIQVKSGNAHRITGQMERTDETTERRAIGYAPDIENGPWKHAALKGLPIARTLDELLMIIKELQ